MRGRSDRLIRRAGRLNSGVEFAQHRRRFLASTAAAFGSVALLGPRIGRAATAYPLLEGRTVTILVGSDVGGNFDLFARSIGRHFESEIPDLRVQVQNIPQASGALAARRLQDGPTDGTMLMTSSSGLLSSQVQGDENVAYDLSQWSWLGNLAAEARILVLGPGADFADLQQLQAKTDPSSMSVRSKTSYAYHEALWLNAMLGLRIKPVPGYKSVEKEAALIQGEVMLTTVGYPTDRQILESPGVEIVLRLTEGPSLPERFRAKPLLAELIAGDPSVAAIARFMRTSTTILNWMAAPPGTDPEVLAEWRRAFAAAATSPAYLDEASKLGFATALTGGADLTQRIKEIFADLAPLRAQLEAAYRCGAALADGASASCAFL